MLAAKFWLLPFPSPFYVHVYRGDFQRQKVLRVPALRAVLGRAELAAGGDGTGPLRGCAELLVGLAGLQHQQLLWHLCRRESDTILHPWRVRQWRLRE